MDTHRGIILRVKNASKSDIVITIISSSGELIDVLTKHTRSRTSKLPAVLIQGNFIEFSVIKGYAIAVLSEASTLESFNMASFTTESLGIFYLLLEITLKFAQYGAENSFIFDTLYETLFSHNQFDKFAPKFIINLLLNEGFVSDIDIRTQMLQTQEQVDSTILDYIMNENWDLYASNVSLADNSFVIKSLVSMTEQVCDIILQTKQMIL